MTERWRRKRRPWFDIFDEISRLEKAMDELTRRTFEESSKERKAYGPYVYGFSMSVGTNGKPVIREFGNVHQSRIGPRIREEREPLVDIMEDEKDVVIIAELPGVEKEDIILHATGSSLTIDVDTPTRKYHKELKLPTEVDSKSARASYKNGVVEIHLKKLVKRTVKGEKIVLE